MYLLDTNILSELIKRHPSPHLLSQLGSKPAHSLFTSSICVMELRFGSALRDDFETFWQQIIREIISRVNIVPIGEKEAMVAGDILADLRKTGNIIGLEDMAYAHPWTEGNRQVFSDRGSAFFVGVELKNE